MILVNSQDEKKYIAELATKQLTFKLKRIISYQSSLKPLALHTLLLQYFLGTFYMPIQVLEACLIQQQIGASLNLQDKRIYH